MSNSILAPSFKIFIGGKEIPKEYYNFVQNVKIQTTSIGSNKCSIQLSDPNMLIIEGKTIVESTPVKVEFQINALTRGKYNTSANITDILAKEQKSKFEGYVSVIDGDFPEDGSPGVTIHCMDKTHLMNRKPKTRTWENCTYSSVAEKIFREYGFKVVIDDSKEKIESIQQSNVTDIEFVIKMANEIKDRKYLVYIEGETAYFVQRKAPKPKHQLCYRVAPYNLLSFSPRINKENKKEAYNSMDINLKTLAVESTLVVPQVDSLGSIKVKNSSTRK